MCVYMYTCIWYADVKGFLHCHLWQQHHPGAFGSKFICLYFSLVGDPLCMKWVKCMLYLPNSKHESGTDSHSLPMYLLLQNPCYLEQCSNFCLVRLGDIYLGLRDAEELAKSDPMLIWGGVAPALAMLVLMPTIAKVLLGNLDIKLVAALFLHANL